MFLICIFISCDHFRCAAACGPTHTAQKKKKKKTCNHLKPFKCDGAIETLQPFFICILLFYVNRASSQVCSVEKLSMWVAPS